MDRWAGWRDRAGERSCQEVTAGGEQRSFEEWSEAGDDWAHRRGKVRASLLAPEFAADLELFFASHNLSRVDLGGGCRL